MTQAEAPHDRLVISLQLVKPHRPYLTVVGALPMRFVDVGDWPPPLPTPENAGEPGTPPPADSTPAGSAGDSAAAAPDGDDGAPPSLRAAITTTADSGLVGQSREGRVTTGPMVLTPDIVLGYVGNLPRNRGAEPPRFIPAIPEAAPPEEPVDDSTP